VQSAFTRHADPRDRIKARIKEGWPPLRLSCLGKKEKRRKVTASFTLSRSRRKGGKNHRGKIEAGPDTSIAERKGKEKERKSTPALSLL